ncbi:hypothetical protein B0T25DRAFT_541015 [Lasiosphaeria hispida]|uniref:Uncharacterized protein n=1 Tax=Lasiosphaeria hispida TaxID=260671 RepID=A0AAJ0HP19_9PEZI|nr:hypothetical protein B0T25DRAFT_541015 [Lasiosphaeria hispida]
MTSPLPSEIVPASLPLNLGIAFSFLQALAIFGVGGTLGNSKNTTNLLLTTHIVNYLVMREWVCVVSTLLAYLLMGQQLYCRGGWNILPST